ncbi:hypothetical protein M5D96_007756 [Drosophila gunungcola]|uniref:Uncharacterized protein n=1 Tax=Drosophila gunungcola TaxID=103775 RepID=A0A9P9YLC6_9MUSC|nr:hypothetical protein M5D96_007756 [Drosophila gunungcola]
MASSCANWPMPSSPASSRRSTRARWPSSAWRTSRPSSRAPRTSECPPRRPSRASTSGSARTSTRWLSACSRWVARPPTSTSHRLAPRRPTRTCATSAMSSCAPAPMSSPCSTDRTRAPPSPESTSATPGTCRFASWIQDPPPILRSQTFRNKRPNQNANIFRSRFWVPHFFTF